MAGRPSLGRKFAGFGLLGLGALGLVLPILQGILFLALGLFVLRDQYDWARDGMAKLRARWPRQVDGVEAMLGARAHLEVIEIPHDRYVGAKIGIHNPRGEKVGQVGRLRNVEYLFVATESRLTLPAPQAA